MRAVAFALTGWDGANVTAQDLTNCVFAEAEVTPPQDLEVFYLNNVDRTKLTFRWRQQPFADRWVSVVDITLAGDRAVHEYRPGRGSARSGSKTNRYKLTIYDVRDYKRLVRVWKYIYTHGCVGALTPAEP